MVTFSSSATFLSRSDENEKTNQDVNAAIKVTANETPINFIRLRWNFTSDEKRKDSIKILGDSYERGYGDIRWAGIEPERTMPFS
mgnify:CR=1 FL=1